MSGLMIAGICLILFALALGLWQQRRIVRHVNQYKVSAAEAGRVYGAGRDWCNLALWFGIALVLVSQLVHQVQRDEAANRLTLSMASSAAIIFICGMFAGRLMLRAQQRREGTIDGHDDGIIVHK